MTNRVKYALGGAVLLLALVGIAVWATGQASAVRFAWWTKDLSAVSGGGGAADEPTAGEVATEPKTLRLSKQSRRNLDLISKPVRVQDYWRTLQIPGMVVDRPGQTDRGVTAPLEGVVEKIHATGGDTVHSGEVLFTLRLFSESLQETQAALFQATREVQLLNEQLSRLETAARAGALAEARMIEFRSQLRRQETQIQSYQHALEVRGFTAAQIANAAEGHFLSTIEVVVPSAATASPAGLEVQELKVGLGEQVQAGQQLATLADHHALYIEGYAFKNEASLLSRAAAEGWEVEVEFTDDAFEGWPPLDQKLLIRHLSNSIDPETRTLGVYIPLANQSRSYQKNGQTFLSWRFRPGQRVRIFVPVEKFSQVLVVPSEAVVREGPEAFVFRQNGDLFDRISVHVLHEDRRHVVLAHDGSVTPGLFLAQNAAASLNRVLQTQSASGMPANVHVHADGTVHAAH
ncbi:efflux RND transporter periplasmic adaptor subunit [Candidatus Laterigemmans baculatus]|uniref:efflux RND transporter periplasmic adaptor subunit n=1 Tax=Candidatus Laterigemmans baculatus TaxID=2770505 RepID=UPI0013DB1E81|nr:efflux RND transporter periplasmic adaptor subunit [Candidatus Laterigemmans baculatus]